LSSLASPSHSGCENMRGAEEEKIIVELSPMEYSMLMFVLTNVAQLKGSASASYAEKLLRAIEAKSRTIGDGSSDEDE